MVARNFKALPGVDNESLLFTQSGAGAVERTIEDKLQDVVNVKDFGAVGDGVNDDTAAIQAAINTGTALVPPGKYRVTSTLTVGTRGRALIGTTSIITTRPDNVAAEIFYDGPENNLLPLIKLGANNVGAQPDVDATACVVQNIILNCNSKAGFGIYGTYVTNESLVDRVTVYNALEFGVYIAKSWYATYTNIFVRGSRGNGIGLGMPLLLLNGVDYSASWTGPSFELNGVKVSNLRTSTTGTYFSSENPNTWTPNDSTIRKQGYGLGVGSGNGLHVSNVTLEASGGVCLYVYNLGQPSKTIVGGYIENSASNSGLDPAVNKPAMILDVASGSNAGCEIRDFFINNTTGGIYHTGNLSAELWLKNIHQPTFLKSLDGVDATTLYATVLKENVRYECGYYNTNRNLMTSLIRQTVNSRYSFTINVPPSSAYKAVYIKGDGTVPIGSWVVTYEDGSGTSYAYPSGLGTDYVLAYVLPAGLATITKGGATDVYNSDVTFWVLSTPPTFY